MSTMSKHRRQTMMNFKKLWIFILLVLIPFALNLFGVNRTGSTSTTIEWTQWYAHEMKKGGMDKILDLFHKEHPEIQVKLVTVPFAKMREQIITTSLIGKAGDVLGLNPPWCAEFVDSNVLEPLDFYLTSAQEFNIQNLAQGVMQKYKGHFWMVPLTAFPFVMFGNKGLMKEAGIENPPSTWEELKEATLKMTIPEKTQFGYGIFMSLLPPSNGPIIMVYPLLYSAGGRTIKNGMSNLYSPEVIETLKFLKDLNDLGVVMPGICSLRETQLREKFSSGNIGIILANMANIQSVYQRNPDLNLEVFPIPKKKKWATRMHGWMLGISSKSKHKEEAWTFISWLLTPEINALFANLSSQLPGNVVANKYMEVTDPNVKMCQYIMKNHELVEELMLTKKAPASWRIFTEELQKMFKDEQDAVLTAKNAHKRWNELFATTKE